MQQYHWQSRTEDRKAPPIAHEFVDVVSQADIPIIIRPQPRDELLEVADVAVYGQASDSRIRKQKSKCTKIAKGYKYELSLSLSLSLTIPTSLPWAHHSSLGRRARASLSAHTRLWHSGLGMPPSDGLQAWCGFWEMS